MKDYEIIEVDGFDSIYYDVLWSGQPVLRFEFESDAIAYINGFFEWRKQNAKS